MKFYESGSALAQDMGVPVSKKEETLIIRLLENRQESRRRTTPSVPEWKVLGRGFRQDRFRKKITTLSFRERTSQRSRTMSPSSSQSSTSALLVSRLMRTRLSLVRIPSQFQASIPQVRLQEVCTATTAWEAWSLAGWRDCTARNTCWVAG